MKLQQFFIKGTGSKLNNNVGDSYCKFLTIESVDTEASRGTNRSSTHGSLLNEDGKDNPTTPSSSISPGRNGLGNRFSPTKLSRMMRRAPNGDVPKEQNARKLTKWFKKKKEP